MSDVATKYYKRDFWIKENETSVQPHFRLEKSARIINEISRGRECDLLDIGCGPATLMRLLRENVHYHGIDIAIHNPAPNLVQTDFLENPIRFRDQHFDIPRGAKEFSNTRGVFRLRSFLRSNDC